MSDPNGADRSTPPAATTGAQTDRASAATRASATPRRDAAAGAREQVLASGGAPGPGTDWNPDRATFAAVAEAVAAQAPGWQQALSRDEIRELLQMNDLRSWLSVGVNWGLVFGSMALVAAWPNPLTVVLALCVIGARQLGFAVLMHEASHRTLLSQRRLNDFVGNWLCAYPVWSDLYPYRPYHLQHHAKTGTADDPDVSLVTPFPITRSSLWRKVWRDLSGQTGWKRARAILHRDLGRSSGRTRRDFNAGPEALTGVVVTNLALLAILWAAGHPALYLLWVGAWLTTYSLVMRIRSIAEHAMTPEATCSGGNPLRNTRTTLASWWERLLLAPNRVNYHLEHHLLMTVPHYNLPRMHRMLQRRGALTDGCVTRGYGRVLSRAASKPEPAGSAA